jgi:hypothetical protein
MFCRDEWAHQEGVMPTLDVRGVVVSGNLTVNYHHSRVPNDHQKRFLDDALKIARTILGVHVLPALTSHALKEAIRLNMESLVDSTLLAILQTHFRLPGISTGYKLANFGADLAIITSFFTRTYHGINQPLTIADSYSAVVDGRDAEAANGYVRMKAGAVKNPVTRKFVANQLASIHVNFANLKQSAVSSQLTVARTIIHEGTHKFCDTEDHSYRYDTSYKTLTKAQALDNADSYAYAAVSIYKKKPITQMEDNLIPH